MCLIVIFFLSFLQKLCRLLACPYGQTPYYGACKSITKQTNGLDVATLFMLTEIPGQSTLQLSNFSWEGLESLAKNIYKETRSLLGLNPPKCSYCDAMMYVGGGSDQNVTFDVNLKTTPECQLDFIMEQHNALMGRYINMKIGKHDNICFLVGPRKRHTETEPLGIRQIWVPDRKGVFSCNNVFTLDKDVYCPVITLNISEHQLLLDAKQRSTFLSHFENHGSDRCNTTKVCLNTYLLSMKTSGCRHCGIALTLLLAMSIILLTRLVY